MYKGIGGSSGYGIGKIVIIKNDMPVYEIKSPENKENEIKRFLQAVDKFIEKTTKKLFIFSPVSDTAPVVMRCRYFYILSFISF